MDNIYIHPVFSKVIKNEFTLYGQLIRDVLYSGEKMMNLMKIDNIPIYGVTCYGNINFKNILERDLSSYIVKIYDNNLNESTHIKKIIYTILLKNTKLNLEVYYTKNNYLRISFYQYLNIYLDIDALTIDRYGHSYIPISNLYSIHPIPINTIISNIKSKNYKLLDNIETISIKFFNRIIRLRKKGWKNIDSNLHIYSSNNEQLTDEDCPICAVKHNRNSVILKCGHCFHHSCVIKFTKIFLSKREPNKELSCPYCTKKIYIKDIL